MSRHQSIADIKDLAIEFDRLSKERDPLQLDHIIAHHRERPESFKWFVSGVLYERDRMRKEIAGE